MKSSPLRWRAVLIRVRYEWQRAGGIREIFRRLGQIVSDEGRSGVLRRLQNLTTPIADRTRGSAQESRADSDVAKRNGLLLIGHPFSVLGVGENLRSTSVAVANAEIPFHVCNVLRWHGRAENELADFRFAAHLSDARTRYSANLFVLNANEMELALTYLGHQLFAGSYNIACWMWELSEFPKPWVKYFRYVDEIWAQSRFVEEAIAPVAPLPVYWMPQVIEPGPADSSVAQKLGVRSGTYTFLFFFDFTSYIARKNPLAVVEAFKLAFADSHDESVALVIKIQGQQHRSKEHRAFLESVRSRDPRIVLIDRTLSGPEIRGLISGCNAFVSLHRSEGFGRGLAEAMYYGKATIATAYSGNMDYMNASTSCLVDYKLVPVRRGEYPYHRGQVWAEPDIEHAARWMRRLVADRALGTTLGGCAAESIRATHGASAVGARMRERLTQLGLL